MQPQGIMYMTAPIAYVVLRNNCGWRKTTCVLGFIVMIISLIAASFANTVPQLIATQGVLYAVGGSLHYFPAYLYIDEWFVQRRGLAYGLFIAGAGASGVGVPLLMEWILHFWGFRIAFRVWALICVLITTPALFCLKPYPSSIHQDKGQRKLDWKFLKSPAFWILSFGNSVQSMGYFIPLLYLQCNQACFNFDLKLSVLTRAFSIRSSTRVVSNHRHHCYFCVQRSQRGRCYARRLASRSVSRYPCNQYLHGRLGSLRVASLGVRGISAFVVCIRHHVWSLCWRISCHLVRL